MRVTTRTSSKEFPVWSKSKSERAEKTSRLKKNFTPVNLKTTGDIEGYFLDRWSEQNGECAICHTPEYKLDKRFALDHDHSNGNPRGLLCDRCNRLLGLAREDRDLLFEACRYLKKWEGAS